MMRSLFAGVSGLRTHQTRMDVIGNNIANVNTVGYKGSRVTFQDVLSQTIRNATAPAGIIGGTNPQQVGLGVSLGTIDVNHTQGNIQMTGIATDLALEGDGYFVVTDGARQYYTRAGVFGLDKLGNLVNSTNGMYVAGWRADDNGNIDTTQPIKTLQIPLGLTSPPKATKTVVFGGNLNADANGTLTLSGASFTVEDETNDIVAEFSVTLKPTGAFNEYEMIVTRDDGGSFIDIAPNGSNTTLSSFRTTLVVQYNNGNWELVPKDGSALEAKFEVDGATYTLQLSKSPISFDATNSLDLSDLFDVTEVAVSSTGTFTYKPAVVQQTTEVYDSLGRAHTIVTVFEKTGANTWTWTVNPPKAFGGNVGSGVLTFDDTGRNPQVTVDSTLTFKPGDANELTISFDFSAMTKYSDETSLFLLAQDGYPYGTLEGFSIDTNGVLIGEFSNGLTRALGQIAVASFANPQGLLRAGENLFAASNNSGTANIGVAGVGGRGTLTPGAIEMSNVDLSQEFTEMIITQRGFQANSRIITASDEMLQELVNLKR